MQTFNLRRTNASKTDTSLQSTANSNVVAILEKANAIRQVGTVQVPPCFFFLSFPSDYFHVIRLWLVRMDVTMITGVIYDHLTADAYGSLFLYIQLLQNEARKCE